MAFSMHNLLFVQPFVAGTWGTGTQIMLCNFIAMQFKVVLDLI